MDPCRESVAVESLVWSLLRDPYCRILAVESLLWNPCCGIFAVESLLWNPCCGILAVDSLASGNHLGSIWEPSGGHLGGIWRHPGDTQEARGSQEAPRRHPGRAQEAPRRHPGGTQGTQESPEGLGTKIVTKLLRFTIESGATDHLACTKRARPSPSTLNSNKYGRTRGANIPADTS